MTKSSPEYVPLYGVLVKASDLSRLRKIAEALLPLAARDVPREQAKRLAVKSAQHVLVQYRNAVARIESKRRVDSTRAGTPTRTELSGGRLCC